MPRPIRLLTFSTLYPNSEQPHHGVFVENRLRHLVASGEVESRVVAPVPWYPFRSPKMGEHAALARVPALETRHGITVHHPRYYLPPKIGMIPAPFLMYMGVRRAVARLRQESGDFDAIDAHYFYPDGVAAALLARELGKPLVITARGTDLNLIPQFSLPRQMIRWASEQASAMITVAEALRRVLLGLGVSPERVQTLRNGVDLECFQPQDRTEARSRLGITVDGKWLASVGHLIERKGHHLVIGALPGLPGVRLMIAGTGPDEGRLRALAEQYGVADRVTFLGRVQHNELATVYSAADALVLASSREGWANVLLESMASGTPVVASNIWGTPEVVATDEAGRLMGAYSEAGVAEAVTTLLSNPPSRQATRRYAEHFSWDDTTRGQLTLFRSLIAP